MTPDHGDQHDPPLGPQPGDGKQTGEATRYGAALPADAATNYRPAPPSPADTGGTRYAEQPTDTDRTNYRAQPPADEANAAHDAPQALDPGATDYTPTESKADAPSAGRLPCRFGGYELLAEIGHGGMGLVYKARQLAPERLVALKMIRAGELATDEDVRRFRLEANEAARLAHPHIVPVYEVGEHQGRHYFTMRLLEGGSLAEHLGRYRQDRQAAARLVAWVARAVHHAHQRQLLHRDLKPGNVLLDAEGQPHVADFGLAKRLSGAGEVSQSVGPGVGTPEYMAPEQARGEARLTTAADVYGLGGILYALLAGRPPFKGASHWETIEQLLSREPSPPSAHSRGCPRDLETICLKCLHKDPARRYGSAEALADDLRRFLEGRPITARPASPAEFLWRWCGRNPALAGMLAVMLVVVLGSLAGVTTLYLKAERQRRTAEHREAGARAITKFYEDHVLAAARPKGWDGGAGKNVTLKEALDQAAPKIHGGFADQPELEAAVRNTLGMTYYYLGEFKAANAQLEQAYAIRRELLGEDDPGTLTCLQNLASTAWRQGNYGEAEAKCRRALEKRRCVLGPEDPDTLWTQLRLGLFLLEQDRLDEAEVLLRPGIESCKRRLGPYNDQTLFGQSDLAWVLLGQGKVEEAVALNRETLEGRRRSLGPENPDTLRSMGNLAFSLGYLGKLDEAIPLCREGLALKKQLLGPEHIETLMCEYYLGNLLGRKGDYAEAEKVLGHAVEASRRLLGPKHPYTLWAMAFLGEVRVKAGRPADAEPLLRESLEGREKTLPAGHSEIADGRRLLGHCLARQGRFAEAEPLFLAGYERMAKGAPPSTVAETLDGIIELYEKWGKPEQAEAWRKKRLTSPALTALPGS
jgi:tetratricopeptide (TPR) repeat protein